MSKSKPIPDAVRRRAIAAVAAAWESGCPVAAWQLGQEAVIADICLRRYHSLARRSVAADDRAAQIRDLAHGMAQAFEPDHRHVGPGMRDYEWLAERVLDAITAGSQDA